jgi:hypothetical protein
MTCRSPSNGSHDGEASLVRRALIVAVALLLAACVPAEDLDQPLSPTLIRSALAGRTLLGTQDGQRVYLHLAPNGVAVRETPSGPEYGQWRPDERGLCLVWRDEGERCAPVRQEHIGRYVIGDTSMNVMGR